MNKVNLSKLDSVKAANDGAPIDVVHPISGELLGLRIHVMGKDSDVFRQVVALQSRRRLARITKGGGFKLDAVPQSEIEADAVITLAKCTTAFTDGENKDTTIVLPDNEEVAFSEDNAAKVYTKLPWLREQIDVAIGDRANFLLS